MSFLEKLGYTMEIECENDCQTKISPMKELKSVLDQEKVCHHLVQIHLSSHLLCRSIIKLYKTIFFYEHETWSLSFRPKHRLWAVENRVMNISVQKEVM